MTLSQRCGDGFQVAVVDHMRGKAKLARDAINGSRPGPGDQAHVSALDALAEYVRAPERLEDPRLLALYEFQTKDGDRMQYRPGAKQSWLLSQLGRDAVASTPDPARTLDWLVYAAVHDLIAEPREELRVVRIERDRLAKRAEEREAFEQELIGTAAQLDAANDQIGQLQTELDRAEAERDYLRDLLPENVEKAKQAGRPRRKAPAKPEPEVTP